MIDTSTERQLFSLVYNGPWFFIHKDSMSTRIEESVQESDHEISSRYPNLPDPVAQLYLGLNSILINARSVYMTVSPGRSSEENFNSLEFHMLQNAVDQFTRIKSFLRRYCRFNYQIERDEEGGVVVERTPNDNVAAHSSLEQYYDNSMLLALLRLYDPYLSYVNQLSETDPDVLVNIVDKE